MTTQAATMRALVDDAIGKNIKPVIASGIPLESYQALYNHNNCLFVLGVLDDITIPFNTDYVLYILNYERVFALLIGDGEGPIIPVGPSTVGVSEDAIRDYLRILKTKDYNKYRIYLDGGNFYENITEADYTDNEMFKLKIKYAQTQMIPPVVTPKFVYGTYYNINAIIIPLRDVSTIFTAPDVPAEVLDWSNKLLTTGYTINLFNKR